MGTSPGNRTRFGLADSLFMCAAYNSESCSAKQHVHCLAHAVCINRATWCQIAALAMAWLHNVWANNVHIMSLHSWHNSRHDGTGSRRPASESVHCLLEVPGWTEGGLGVSWRVDLATVLLASTEVLEVVRRVCLGIAFSRAWW